MLSGCPSIYVCMHACAARQEHSPTVLPSTSSMYSALCVLVSSNILVVVKTCVLCLCSMAATVMQLYLRQVLESYFHTDTEVRRHASEVAIIVLRQGLVQVAMVSLLLDFQLSWILPTFCFYILKVIFTIMALATGSWHKWSNAIYRLRLVVCLMISVIHDWFWSLLYTLKMISRLIKPATAAKTGPSKWHC